ncbi:nucleotidyltransferase family protein [Candidatus Hydrogenedentota bacterium]
MEKKQHLNSVGELQALLKESNILQRFAIHRLGIFGSFSRSEPANDIDILIEDDLTLEEAASFRQALEALVDNRLDIMIERLANPIILYRARKDMRYVEG